MDTPYGPARLPANRQVAIPKEVLDLMGLRTGDRIYFLIDESDPQWLRLVPEQLVVTGLDRGLGQNSPQAGLSQ